MKRFEFRLQRVLDLRNTQLAIEESRVKQQAAVLADLDRQRAEAQAAAASAETEVRGTPGLAGRDLAMLGDFRTRIQIRQKLIAQRRLEGGMRLVAMQATMMEARRRCRLLERLKDRRHAEWKAAQDKEIEELAADAFLSGWGRESR